MYMTSTIRTVNTRKAPNYNMLKVFGGVKSSKKVGLPGQHKDSVFSNSSIFIMKCSVAVKMVNVNYDIVDHLIPSLCLKNTLLIRCTPV